MPPIGESFDPGLILPRDHGHVLLHMAPLSNIPRTLRVVECILWVAVEFGEGGPFCTYELFWYTGAAYCAGGPW